MNTTAPNVEKTIESLQQAALQLTEAAHHGHSMWQSLGLMAVYAIAGVLVAVLGYKLFDWFTPGDLHKEIVENKNVAAAIVGAAIILGVCILVAASIIG